MPGIFISIKQRVCFSFHCADYLGHPFVENDGFCERMSHVASTALRRDLQSNMNAFVIRPIAFTPVFATNGGMVICSLYHRHGIA